jgi:hypothetical protein
MDKKELGVIKSDLIFSHRGFPLRYTHHHFVPRLSAEN